MRQLKQKRLLISAIFVASLYIAMLALLSQAGGGEASAEAAEIRLGPGGETIEVAGLGARLIERLIKEPLADCSRILEVYPGERIPNQEEGLPPMLGSCSVDAGRIVFRPRFPLRAGLKYTARLMAGESEIVAALTLPEQADAPSTRVEAIYPSDDLLPANQLKFYLHFSAPMSIGEAYARLHLYDEAGREVPRPFLRLDAELWDPSRRRMTLLLDPGRIKRGLRSNLEDGPPLKEGGRYRLAIDREWRDGEGRALEAGYEKTFSVAADDRQTPDWRKWRIVGPGAEGAGMLRLVFDEPMDRALLERMIEVCDESGERVSGRIEIADGEREWRFRPDAAWREGRYEVRVDRRIEDRAGNSLERLFDADLREKESAESSGNIVLRFEVAPL